MYSGCNRELKATETEQSLCACVCEVGLDVLPGPKSSENSLLAVVLIMDCHKQLRMCQHG